MPTPDYPVQPNQSARIGSSSGLRIREDSAYTNAKGEENKGIHKRTDEALAKLQEPLSKILEPDEAIFYVARAREKLSTLEQLFLGWHAVFASDSLLLVLTNRRLIQIRVKGNGNWNQGIRVARWGDIQEAKVKGLGGKMIFLTYKNGTKEAFWQIRGDDGKKVDLLVPTLLQAGTGESTSAQGAVSLCPMCMASLTPEVYECNKCHQVFKNKSAMSTRAWLIPGGAYFYTGHWFLGITGGLGEAILLIFALVWLAVAAGMPDPFADAQNPAATSAQAAIIAVIFLAFVALAKWVGLTHGRRSVARYMPAS
ncbi:MAG TPA: hypothetical protein VFM21_10925 [Terriglobia bacterium]|nr:hypothetical protein [Terriglobia bacterium]